MSQKEVLITGANRGIGYEFARQYAKKGYKVTAVCRNNSKQLTELDVDIVEGIDVTKASDLLRLSETLGDKKIDILVNNAGLLHKDVLGELDAGNIRAQFEVNALAPLRVTEALLPNLKEGSKVAMITSRMGSIADNGSGSRYGYRMSKAALNAAGKSLSLDLKDQGISVVLLHPGFVQTDMVNHAGDIPAETAAERLIQRIDELSLDTTGQFFHSNGEGLPW
ncbi:MULTISPECIES: SDR family oxidoreductase [Idiomarina]|jgi:NAD(P)-dependent dehydrogenase (short-subunit alcohol dehydrogenase family)|uniref:SDR family oxidoreductase n=1 Tax=Idiomarina TaxID=135575 RepID=UPI000C49A07C|nr:MULTISPECIES: SDR family oxidoreductase [Idiomarina]MAB22245.1 short-chain dehydrogenase [Idiomarina sp.]MBH94642.1 short-chain dehydrogenase [Idiomarina sp.]|tara:strand:+ start:2743 stop:3411 length:669 start_codon:yes stop_codon:yes gene_type:complete